LGRRVVVTGIGLICGVGNTTEEVWKSLLAGKSGVARISQFDPSQFACQIAAEVKNFDPLDFVEKKELKKMGRFIYLALAATDEAMKSSGLTVTDDIADRTGVHIGSGIGGFDVIERGLGEDDSWLSPLRSAGAAPAVRRHLLDRAGEHLFQAAGARRDQLVLLTNTVPRRSPTRPAGRSRGRSGARSA